MSGLSAAPKAPILILSFNRPDYLAKVLESLRAQVACDLGDRTIVLFQDGAVNPFSGKRYAEDDKLDESVAVFRQAFPDGAVMRSPDNLGIALNFDRAERYGFETLAAEAAIFLEDDLVLGPHYISTLDSLVETFRDDTRVGYVAAYGDHRTSAEQQRANSHRLAILTHNWAFALYRRQWLRMRDRVLQYLDIVRGGDYNLRDRAKIEALFASWGYGCPANSQDAAKTIACCADNVVKINTYVCNAAYIGERGVHMTPRIFADWGYDRTALYPEKISTFERLDDRLYQTLLRQQLAWAGKPAPSTVPPAASVQAAPNTPSSNLPVMMTAAEIELMTKYLKKSRYYLEFGCGGSTLLALAQSPGRIVSVESDAAWIAKLKEQDAIQKAVASNRLAFYHADIGPVREFGAPKDESRIKQWKNYYMSPWLFRDFDYDLVLIDGRFRVMCALAAVMCAEHATIVAIHDYGNRRGYFDVEPYFDTIDYADKLVVLQKRPRINYKAWIMDFVDHLYDAG